MEAGGARLIRYSDPEAIFSIWALADIHYSNRGCLTSKLIEDVGTIHRDPYALWSLLGDTCDWIVPGDPRWDPACIDPDIKIADLADLGALLTDRIIRYLAPIRAKCLAAGLGNHDLRYFTEKQQRCVHGQLCEALGAVNLMYSGFVVLYFERVKGVRRPQFVKHPRSSEVCRKGQRRLVVYQNHGFGAAATPGGRINALKREVEIAEADLLMMGHLHDQIGKVFVQLATDPLGKQILQKPRLAMMTGSYLRGYVGGCTEYPEVKGYPATVLGASRAKFRPADGWIGVETCADGAGVICG